MTERSIAPIEADDLRARAERTAGGLTVRLEGSADARSHDAVDALLGAVHHEVLTEKVDEVVVDLRDCDFISSSCLKAFVVWLSKIQDAEEATRYRLRFLSDDNKPWQRRSLGTLHCFAVDLVTIESGVGARG